MLYRYRVAGLAAWCVVGQEGEVLEAASLQQRDVSPQFGLDGLRTRLDAHSVSIAGCIAARCHSFMT